MYCSFKTIFVSLLLGCTLPTIVKSQNKPYNEVSIASPTAASLGKYGDVPVSYHTGIPKIDIPIYTVKEGNLALPISLNYHAGGLKVIELASWVGQGWSLNAGGVITRTVKGAPDERGTTGNSEKGHFSDYGYDSYFNWDQLNHPGGYYVSNIASGLIDAEPDLFFYNVNGISGKFFFRDDRTPILLPEQDVKIEPYYTGSGSISSFTITTSDGTKYLFGKTASTTDVDPVEYTNAFTVSGGTTSSDVISSWYLNSIISFDDLDAITLSYVAEKYSYHTLSMTPVDENATPNSWQSYPFTKEYGLVKNFVNGVRLSNITFSNGKVDFIGGALREDLSSGSEGTIDIGDYPNAQSKTLGSIVISDNSSVAFKKFNFSYGYWFDNTTQLPPYFNTYNSTLTTDKKRLRLESVQEKSGDETVLVPPYSFQYFTTFAPRRINFAIDHWGFYNGVINTGLIPTYTKNDYTVVYGADRDARFPEMQTGALKKITYPLGGSTEFEFENNQTWASKTTTVTNTLFSQGVGYSQTGMVHTIHPNIYFSGNIYKVALTNNACVSPITSCAAYVRLDNSSSNIIYVEGGQSNFVMIQPTAGYHTIHLYKDQATGGQGAQATFTETYLSTTSQNEIVGGLRVKKITDYDGINTANNVVTNYSYVNPSDGHSTAILFSRPTYVQVIRNQLMTSWVTYTSGGTQYVPNLCGGCMSCPTVAFFQSPSSVQPMETTQGSHIGYEEVKVSKVNNGYTLYRYWVPAPYLINRNDVAVRRVNTTTCDATTPDFPAAPIPFDFMRGELKYEGHFDNTGLLKETNYKPVFVETGISTPAITTGFWNSSRILSTRYELKTSKKTRMETIENTFIPGMGLISKIDTIFYESPYHHQETRRTTVNSKGEYIETKTKYSFDFRLSTCDATTSCTSTYLSACASCESIKSSAYTACAGSSSCILSADMNYFNCMKNARNSFVSCQQLNYTGSPNNNFKDCFGAALNVAGTELKPILKLQEDGRYLPVETSNWKKGLLVNSSFVRYDYSSNPATEVYPQKIQTLNPVVLASTFTPAATASGNATIVKDSRYTDESFMKFVNGNLVELKKKDGVTNSYIWDYNGNFPTAQVTNADVSDISYTSFETDATGNLNYSWTRVADVTAPSGLYGYNINYPGSFQRTGLNASKNYIISYWTKGSVNIAGGTQSNIVNGAVRNGWTFRQRQVTGTTALTFAGAGRMDELRIYPIEAQMTSYTYNPLIGVTSKSDPKSDITYYDYDKMGRLKNIKDQNKDITQNYFYNYGAIPTTPPVLVAFSNAKGGALTSYNVQLTSKSTGQIFNYIAIPNSSNDALLGNIPPGLYDIRIYPTEGSQPTSLFQICSYSFTGTETTFYNISVTASSCNILSISKTGI